VRQGDLGVSRFGVFARHITLSALERANVARRRLTHIVVE
jgi:hypothetical protein